MMAIAVRETLAKMEFAKQVLSTVVAKGPTSIARHTAVVAVM